MARKYMRNEDVVKELRGDFRRLEEKVMEVIGSSESPRLDGGRGSVPWDELDWLPVVKQWIRGFEIYGGQASGAKAMTKGFGVACAAVAENVKEPHISNLFYHLANWLQHIEVQRLSDVPWFEFLRAVEEDCEREYLEPEPHEGCSFAEFFEAVNRQYIQVLRQSESLWITSPWQSIVQHPIIGPQTTDGKTLMFLPYVLGPFAHALMRYAMWRNEGTGKAGEELPREVGTLDLPEDVPFSHP